MIVLRPLCIPRLQKTGSSLIKFDESDVLAAWDTNVHSTWLGRSHGARTRMRPPQVSRWVRSAHPRHSRTPSPLLHPNSVWPAATAAIVARQALERHRAAPLPPHLDQLPREARGCCASAALEDLETPSDEPQPIILRYENGGWRRSRIGRSCRCSQTTALLCVCGSASRRTPATRPSAPAGSPHLLDLSVSASQKAPAFEFVLESFGDARTLLYPSTPNGERRSRVFRHMLPDIEALNHDFPHPHFFVCRSIERRHLPSCSRPSTSLPNDRRIRRVLAGFLLHNLGDPFDLSQTALCHGPHRDQAHCRARVEAAGRGRRRTECQNAKSKDREELDHVAGNTEDLGTRIADGPKQLVPGIVASPPPTPTVVAEWRYRGGPRRIPASPTRSIRNCAHQAARHPHCTSAHPHCTSALRTEPVHGHSLRSQLRFLKGLSWNTALWAHLINDRFFLSWLVKPPAPLPPDLP
ncbi:hypothetical protein DFH06DRAFT_1341264 [Mycena polygramma]|nr:hypothetical protein DFH06DRAFT_1341264 [Mycena polygramma]